ncbi:Kinesin-like protein KIF14 [Toxocara canis]|uniref:Kinesin-like protein KIF14 n=1 Tax=Toxocara canis TaxID=6265 RepID=A0A0B2V145_TOXCA|nr:Kinesin-like protein KIF14 [Toxocara canis]
MLWKMSAPTGQDNSDNREGRCRITSRRFDTRSRSEQRKPAVSKVGRPRSASSRRAPDTAGCNIQVALRVRPFDEHESRQEALLIEGNNVEVLTADKKCSFKFAHIFGPESSQEDVYKKFALPLLAHVLSGINACIFAYGQTGSGKTYSIVGNHDNPGLLQRFGKDFFDAASEVKPEERKMAVSFYEIYQEKAYDLLGDGRQALRVRGAEETYLGGLTEAVVSSFNDFENLRRRAWAKRATASTVLNRHSSRSHAIVRLVYRRTVTENAGEETRPFGIISHIYFVDLAGLDEKDEGKSAFEKQFVRSVKYMCINRKEKRESRKGGCVSLLLDMLSDIHNNMLTLRSIDKGVVKGMPFLTGICAFAQLNAELGIITDVLSSCAILSPDAESSTAEDDNTELRALVLDSIEGMVPRIITDLGKAAFWMDERLGDKQLPQKASDVYMIGLRAAVDEVCEENDDIYRCFSVMPSTVSQIITKTSEALREACMIYKETPNERLLFGIIKPLFLILRSPRRFNVGVVLQQLAQILNRTINSSLPRSQGLIAALQKAVKKCSGGSTSSDFPPRPPARPRFPDSAKDAVAGGSRFNVGVVLQQLAQILNRTINSSLPRSRGLIAALQKAVKKCSGGSTSSDFPPRPPARPRFPDSAKDAVAGGSLRAV